MERRFEPRKQPRQQRSQAVVDAIIEAATRILETDGFDKLTTNHVAEVAGVSVGSLYQYFPNKEAICYALSERMFDQFTQSYLAALQEVATAELEVQVKALVDVGVSIAREFQRQNASYQQFSEFGGFDPLKKSIETLAPALARMIASREATPPGPHAEYMAYVSLTACSEVMADVSFRFPERLDDPLFVEHLYCLVWGYVEKAEGRFQ